MPAAHGRFVWYELTTTDVAAAKAFYRDVIGWDTQDAATSARTYTLFTTAKAPASALLELPKPAREKGATPHWIGYVAVDDVDAAAERTLQLGGTVRVPPTDIPDISRFAVIADPQMATLALVKGMKPGQERHARPVEPGHVGWHELLAADWEKALAFYGALFGWQKADSHVGTMGTYQYFSAAGETIGGMFTKPATLPVPFWLYYVNVEDVDAAAGRAEAGGGEILYGPTGVPGGARIAHCLDPQGAIFALLDRRGRQPVGYFESGAGRPGSRGRRWSW